MTKISGDLFIYDYAKTGNVPNADTLAAMKEVEEMEKHPEQYKGYRDVDEMMKDLLSDI